jgi:hypothetical protein
MSRTLLARFAKSSGSHCRFAAAVLRSRDVARQELIAAWEAGDRGIRLQDQFRLFAALRIRPAQFFERPS